MLFRLSSLLAFALLATISTTEVIGGPTGSGHGPGRKRCRKPVQRHEWRDLNRRQKRDYIEAVQCLQRLPAKTSFPGVKSRFDDYQALHVDLTREIHHVGQFLPWHRRMVQAYEGELRDHCGYKGGNPYWDWTRDADTGTVKNSPIFDPVEGFGGNGLDVPDANGTIVPGAGGGCVTNGPFASYMLSIGPGQNVTNHCLVRRINDRLVQYGTTAQVQNTTIQTTFELFRQEAGGAFKPPPYKIHDVGHASVSGEMGNIYSSPGDPLFYLHHANLDRVWWIWQEMDLANRLEDISGNTSVDPPHVEVTLDFGLKMSNLAALIPIRDVMDIEGDVMCYTYV